jgi:FlgN protein
MDLSEVSEILWRERELLDVLLFKLEEQGLLLTAGKDRWLARASHEVRVVLEQIRLTELTRAVEVDAVARELGLPSGPSLALLAQAVPVPWSDILRGHRDAFLQIAEDVLTLAAANRELVTAGTVDELVTMSRDLRSLADVEAGRGFTNRSVRSLSYQTSLAATSHALQLPLTDFLK